MHHASPLLLNLMPHFSPRLFTLGPLSVPPFTQLLVFHLQLLPNTLTRLLPLVLPCLLLHLLLRSLHHR
ncbi:unnamed protein product, partial [Closterium sp. NIES-53]